MAEELKKKNKIGRPKKNADEKLEVVDEQSVQTLDMSKKDSASIITIDDMRQEYRNTYSKILSAAGYYPNSYSPITNIISTYTKLNPFLQNQRLKELYTNPNTYEKPEISNFIQNPGASEYQLRSLSWSQSGAQQIYYNILRRAGDIPQYFYYVSPDLFDDSKKYQNEDFKDEDRLVHNWLSTFNVPTTLKTMALQIKREGKQSYLLRNKFVGVGKSKETAFATLQKLPTDWIKITGIGQLGYTVSFNLMYFLNIATLPSDFGEFIEKAWADVIGKGIVNIDERNIKNSKIDFNKLKGYNFAYKGDNYTLTVETKREGRTRIPSYLLWIRMPWDICFTFGSDNSNPWVVPDTMGLLQKLQELSDYGELAGLIASTPLSAVLTGEIETIKDPRAGKNESVFSPEVIQGYQDCFNAVTSTNVEAWMFPAQNIKLQQLNADVNGSDILTKATQNFITNSGEGGLTITTEKPNVSQVKTAQLLAASKEKYVTLQFERALNFIINHKLGFKYKWTLHIWGDIFSTENEKKYLKELVAGGATFLLPKLASAEGISMRETKALMEYIKSLDFYKDFSTWTSVAREEDAEQEEKSVGRPPLEDSDVENDATAASKEAGDNTVDNRDTFSTKCPICHGDKEEGQLVCDECAERIAEENE